MINFKKIITFNCLLVILFGCNSKEEIKRIGFNNLKLRLQMIQDTLGYSYMIMDKGSSQKFLNLDVKTLLSKLTSPLYRKSSFC